MTHIRVMSIPAGRETVVCQISAEQYRLLDALAVATGSRIADLAAHAVETWLKSNRIEVPTPCR